MRARVCVCVCVCVCVRVKSYFFEGFAEEWHGTAWYFLMRLKKTQADAN